MFMLKQVTMFMAFAESERNVSIIKGLCPFKTLEAYVDGFKQSTQHFTYTQICAYEVHFPYHVTLALHWPLIQCSREFGFKGLESKSLYVITFFGLRKLLGALVSFNFGIYFDFFSLDIRKVWLGVARSLGEGQFTLVSLCCKASVGVGIG